MFFSHTYFTRTFIICTASNILIANFCIPLELWIINTSGPGVDTSHSLLTCRCGGDPGVDELDIVQSLLLAQQVFVTTGVTHLQAREILRSHAGLSTVLRGSLCQLFSWFKLPLLVRPCLCLCECDVNVTRTCLRV